MRTVCAKDRCTGCMACVDICPKDAIIVKDSKESYNAIKTDRCVDCGACDKVCHVNNPPRLRPSISWAQGWSLDDKIRQSSSSGGFAATFELQFIKEGGFVCSCAFKNGEFKFHITNDSQELHDFQGSKYVKSNPLGIYKEIVRLLSNGERVLFVGLPCQSASLQKYVPAKYHKSLFTIDLICHGTPSPLILEQFLNEFGLSLAKMEEISFRNSKKFAISNSYQTILPKGVTDRYTIGFLNALFYTENCYHCPYATLDRVSDLTIGDSWGSLLSDYEKDQGISLVLCQSKKGEMLLKSAALHLEEVDLKSAAEENHQLLFPSTAPPGRKVFFDGINSGKSFNTMVAKVYPKICYRQNIKKLLMSLPIVGKIAQNKWGGK